MADLLKYNLSRFPSCESGQNDKYIHANTEQSMYELKLDYFLCRLNYGG